MPGDKQSMAEDGDGDDIPVEGEQPQAPRDPAPEWLEGFRRSGFPNGSYISGAGYGVVFTDRGNDVLVVSCDNLSSARDDTLDRSPWGYGFVAKNGWSQLGIMTFDADWFRNDGLLAYLQELGQSGFFRRFGKVVMTGTSMGGYAACAFASLAPGCTVIAFSPQSTLKADLVPWETRFASGRRADWSGPFADGAVESAQAGQVFLVYDPRFEPDTKHVERFTAPNVVRLPARYSGHKSALFLRRAGLLSSVVRSTVEGVMSPSEFYRIYRGGRVLPWYLHAVKTRLVESERHRLLPRFAAGCRKLGNHPIARTAEVLAVEAGVLSELPRPAPAPRPAAAQAPRPPRNGPHERRLAMRQAQAANAANAANPAAPVPPVANPRPAAPQIAPELEMPEEPEEPETWVDLYHENPDLPPLQPAGDLPWQQVQMAAKQGYWE